MDDVNKMLVKQFLLRVRQEGYTLAEKPPRSCGSDINIDIYRGKTKIATFDDRQLGGKWNLRVTTDDSTRDDIKHDYNKLFYMYIDLRNLYMIYEAAKPLKGYDQSLGYRSIMEYGGYTLAVRGSSICGELEFGTFLTGERFTDYGYSNTILHNIYFEMDNYSAAKLDFVARSGLLPEEQLITPENINYLHSSCSKTMENEGYLFDNNTKNALGNIITGLEKVQDSFDEVKRLISAIPAQHTQYIGAKVFDEKGIFTKHQIDRESLPKGLFAYDIAYSREKMEPENIWPRYIGGRFGTVITKNPVTIGEKGYTELGTNGFSLDPENRCSLQDFLAPIKSRDSSKNKTPETEKPSVLDRLEKKAKTVKPKETLGSEKAKAPRGKRKEVI
jgi:hypothetical protein